MSLSKTDNSAMTLDERMTTQVRLKAHGIDPGPVDGIIGRRTNAAIIAFKRSIGYAPRPYVGPLTMAALMKDPAAPAETGTLNLPDWIKVGLKFKGLHEIYDNAELRAFLASDGHALGDPSVFPWCGDFVETCIRLTLPAETFPGQLGVNPYWALNWRGFGVSCAPVLGAVISIIRNGGGHVAFVMGEDATRYYCLGGNQSNTVSIAPIEKSRFTAASFRWPSTVPLPTGGLPQLTSKAAAESAFA
ncbi:peptidoglycan-binding protein [Pseudooceanicola nanhaiensis]|uniref:NlpC/P60 family protein n=1 Tax=Pseudooceanicola nanhaiensis TaxID=375761 RepID=UPI001CD19952|nr:peptidoglycan-binding protein [Pseudooceanicola nanhaiensis]MCA0920214.1 TIGR02594 family protein [Pseudooceanicola nanhaiensis]